MSHSPERREAPRDREDRAPADDVSSKLFIANLTYNTRNQDLEDIFSKYGLVKDVHIAEDRETGRSKGFAFITMSSAQEAQDAVAGANGYDLDGRQIKVELSNGGSGRRGPGGPPRGDFRGGGRSDACYDFQSGRCSRGSSCRFSHDGEGGGGGGGGGYRGGGGGGFGGDRYGGDRGRDDRDSRDSYRDSRGGGDRYGGSGGGDRHGGGGDRYGGGGGYGGDRGRDRDTRDRSRDRY